MRPGDLAHPEECGRALRCGLAAVPIAAVAIILGVLALLLVRRRRRRGLQRTAQVSNFAQGSGLQPAQIAELLARLQALLLAPLLLSHVVSHPACGSHAGPPASAPLDATQVRKAKESPLPTPTGSGALADEGHHPRLGTSAVALSLSTLDRRDLRAGGQAGWQGQLCAFQGRQCAFQGRRRCAPRVCIWGADARQASAGSSNSSGGRSWRPNWSAYRQLLNSRQVRLCHRLGICISLSSPSAILLLLAGLAVRLHGGHILLGTAAARGPAY